MRGIKFPAIYCKVVFFLSTFLCCSLVFGGEVFSRLDELVQEALAKNPDIRASLQRWESARAVIPQVQTLPDPKVTMGYRDMARQDVMYGLSQEIPFPGKLGLKGEIAARRSDRIEQDYLATQLAVIARLKEVFYDLHFVHDSIRVLQQTMLLLQQFEKTATARYSVGQAAQQDVLRASTEISRLLARLATLEQRRQSLHAGINRILNRLPSDPLGIPEEIRFTPMRYSIAELNDLLDQSSPLLHGQQRTVEQGNQAIALAKREYYPDFELSGLGTRDPVMNVNGYQVMLNIKIPLYYATKQREGVNEAIASREAVFQDLHALRQELLARIKDDMAQAERAELLIKLLRDAIIPQSRLTLASAQASYAVGRVDFLTLLNSLLTLQENELEFHSEMVEHKKALARLEGIIGVAP
ncbi:MAG: TolC family protein [Nitrosomonas sp.]|uniref:TolC family protein n=1 Tax=Nitrosomonas sp. TaxID=42353 RepID=UPI00273145FB|nr:TolC family protein [Nitrosomonas sp.]MDP1787596.1 TolC family protein [Nitrosomonas sp.]MDP3281207.1 TolC family protein [Nitrosomonas sp.]MDP3662498.1 TolC family protein [Nitrosomonas sp.]MDZ4106885.1 TolC family protein [Nitrosomonas sp.]